MHFRVSTDLLISELLSQLRRHSLTLWHSSAALRSHIVLTFGVKLPQQRQIRVRSLHDLQHRRNYAKSEALKAVLL